MAEIRLRSGQIAVVDDDDFPRVARFPWHLKNKQYAVRTVGRHKVYLHHEILGQPPSGLEVDHVDGNGLNNQRRNLRFCTRRQNTQNRRPRSDARSRFKGVDWDPCKKKWRAKIRIDGKQRRIGRFADELEAAYAYDRAALEAFGEFARPNFPAMMVQ